MSYLAVTNFSKFQHYKNRKPPWIKFYVNLLDPHHPINQLPVPARYLFDRLLLLAAEWNNAIPNSPEFVASVVNMPQEDCRESLALLLQGRWIRETTSTRRASKDAGKNAPPETETELEKETPLPPFGGQQQNGGKPTLAAGAFGTRSVTPQPKFKCAHCGVGFRSESAYEDHLANVHGVAVPA